MKKLKFNFYLKKEIIIFIFFIILFFSLIFFLKNRNHLSKENFNAEKNSPDSVSEANLINQMFNPYANFIEIGDTSDTYFRGFNAPIDDPKPFNYIGLRLDNTIVINDITFKDIQPILDRIERKGKEDMDKLLTIGSSPDAFKINTYLQKMLNQQIADSNANTYLYPLNYTSSHSNIYQTQKSKLPQFDNGNDFILFLFIEYFRLQFPNNFNYISLLRYKVLEAKIDRNLNYYYKVQADYFVDTNYTIWALEYEFFMIKVDITIKTLLEKEKREKEEDKNKIIKNKLDKDILKFELSEINTGSYIPIILSCKCVGNYFQDQLFMTSGISPYNYNYGKFKGDTIDDPFEHQFVYNYDKLKAKQFVGLDETENFTGSGPAEAANASNIDRTFSNLDNPRSYSQKEYIKQIVNNQNQSPLANQYACFNTENGNIVLDIYSFKECERNYDDYFRKKPRGVFDRMCRIDADCPYYKQNTNYPNKRGFCNNGFCELPSGSLPLGYRYSLSKTKPLCYNCFTKDWLPITDLHDCCEEQNNREKFPFLKGPDYAFPDDVADRTNYYNKMNCSYFPNRSGDPIANTTCKEGKFFYNV